MSEVWNTCVVTCWWCFQVFPGDKLQPFWAQGTCIQAWQDTQMLSHVVHTSHKAIQNPHTEKTIALNIQLHGIWIHFGSAIRQLIFLNLGPWTNNQQPLGIETQRQRAPVWCPLDVSVRCPPPLKRGGPFGSRARTLGFQQAENPGDQAYEPKKNATADLTMFHIYIYTVIQYTVLIICYVFWMGRIITQNQSSKQKCRSPQSILTVRQKLPQMTAPRLQRIPGKSQC